MKHLQPKPDRTKSLEAEVERLRLRLEEAEQTLEAIRSGQIDSLLVEGPDGPRTIDTKGLFIMVGAAPNTAWLPACVALDDKGFVKTGKEVGAESAHATSHPRVFAVGDVRAGSVKRVASAVGEGSVVINAIWAALHA